MNKMHVTNIIAEFYIREWISLTNIFHVTLFSRDHFLYSITESSVVNYVIQILIKEFIGVHFNFMSMWYENLWENKIEVN